MRKFSLLIIALILLGTSACHKGRNVRKLKKNCNCPKWSQLIDEDDAVQVQHTTP